MIFQNVSVVCFAASYGVAAVLEFSRLFARVRIRNLLSILFTAAGVFAQSVYLMLLLQQRVTRGQAWATWYTGCLVLSWVLATLYLLTALADKRSATGLLLLPTSLCLIAVAFLFPQARGALQIWTGLHGFSLAIGIGLVVLGFIAGLMYLIQSYRLKHKLPPKSQFWLPSLERLQRLNERSLLASTGMLGLGLVSGILLNLIHSGSNAEIPWSDPVVLVSILWLLWLIVILVLSGIYPPARHGRRVAWLTVSSFLFLGFVLAILISLPSDHAASAHQRLLDSSSVTAPAVSGGREP